MCHAIRLGLSKLIRADLLTVSQCSPLVLAGTRRRESFSRILYLSAAIHGLLSTLAAGSDNAVFGIAILRIQLSPLTLTRLRMILACLTITLNITFLGIAHFLWAWVLSA